METDRLGDKLRVRLYAEGVRGVVRVTSFIGRLERLSERVPLDSPEAALIGSVKDSLREAGRDLEILVNRTKP